MIDFCIYLTREKHDPKVYLAVYNNGKCTYVSKDLSGNPEVLYKKPVSYTHLTLPTNSRV